MEYKLAIFLMLTCLQSIFCQETITRVEAIKFWEKTMINSRENKPYFEDLQKVSEPGSCSESEAINSKLAGWFYKKSRDKDLNEGAIKNLVFFYVLLYKPDLPKPPQHRGKEFDDYYMKLRKEAKRNLIAVRQDFSREDIGIINQLAASKYPIYILVHGWEDSIRSLHMINGVGKAISSII